MIVKCVLKFVLKCLHFYVNISYSFLWENHMYAIGVMHLYEIREYCFQISLCEYGFG